MIKNRGKIVPQDIILLGSSTKRGDDTKIGQFGSGSKFALSWLLRNDCKPLIFSGKDPISIETRMVEHRGHPRDVIYVAGENTNITTEFGLKWTAWMALRELISNAVDEGDEQVEVIYAGNGLDSFLDDNTTIFIPLSDNIKDVMDNYKHYFAFERKPDYIGRNGCIYVKDTIGLMNIYRKGIRCYDAIINSPVDFNLADADITEDRLLENGMGEFDKRARLLLLECDDVSIIKKVIMTPEYHNHFIGNLNDTWLAAYQELINEGQQFTSNSYINILGTLVSNSHKIPSGHYKKLITENMINDPMDAAFNHLDFLFVQEDGPSAEVEALLSRVGDFKVFFGKMDSYSYTKFKAKNNEFYIKSSIAKKTPAEIAAMCLHDHPNYAGLIAKLF